MPFESSMINVIFSSNLRNRRRQMASGQVKVPGGDGLERLLDSVAAMTGVRLPALPDVQGADGLDVAVYSRSAVDALTRDAQSNAAELRAARDRIRALATDNADMVRILSEISAVTGEDDPAAAVGLLFRQAHMGPAGDPTAEGPVDRGDGRGDGIGRDALNQGNRPGDEAPPPALVQVTLARPMSESGLSRGDVRVRVEGREEAEALLREWERLVARLDATESSYIHGATDTVVALKKEHVRNMTALADRHAEEVSFFFLFLFMI